MPWRGAPRASRPPKATFHPEEMHMTRKLFVIATLTAAVTGIAYAQFPVMDRVADKVVQKYQSATCEQLWQEKAQGQGQPKPEMEQRAVQMLKQDPQMRQ